MIVIQIENKGYEKVREIESWRAGDRVVRDKLRQIEMVSEPVSEPVSERDRLEEGRKEGGKERGREGMRERGRE